eukprot:TRINITY_DN2482_c0_g3_i2.p1 TRINITY_DN2482_c0_g3~~TRINITY_DN2482_c0_g3_i2.p1  ORF type:complete len:114 (+),score=23.53 TRINITY_DN2482_c0_g3_i2:10-351(+)
MRPKKKARSEESTSKMASSGINAEYGGDNVFKLLAFIVYTTCKQSVVLRAKLPTFKLLLTVLPMTSISPTTNKDALCHSSATQKSQVSKCLQSECKQQQSVLNQEKKDIHTGP